jgi:hypothetical protein
MSEPPSDSIWTILGSLGDVASGVGALVAAGAVVVGAAWYFRSNVKWAGTLQVQDEEIGSIAFLTKQVGSRKAERVEWATKRPRRAWEQYDSFYGGLPRPGVFKDGWDRTTGAIPIAFEVHDGSPAAKGYLGSEKGVYRIRFRWVEEPHTWMVRKKTIRTRWRPDFHLRHPRLARFPQRHPRIHGFWTRHLRGPQQPAEPWVD